MSRSDLRQPRRSGLGLDGKGKYHATMLQNRVLIVAEPEFLKGTLLMKKRFLILAMFAIALVGAHSQTESAPSLRPKEGFVPNAETAVRVAEAVLFPVYGEKKILSERPFKAALEGDVWTVAGTLHCGAPQCNGGTAEVKISRSTGEILQMTHYK